MTEQRRKRPSPRCANHNIQRLNLDRLDGIKLLQQLEPRAHDVSTQSKIPDLTKWLWEQTIQYHQQALDTPFIQGMKNGTLDPALFGVYNLQDAVYCYNATECLKIVKENSHGSMKEFADSKIEAYKDYTESMFEMWHVLNPSGVKMNRAAQMYSAHELDVAKNMDPIYSFISMIPCLRLWPWLGQRLRNTPHNFGVYENWIDTNLSGDGYQHMEEFVNDQFSNINEGKALDVYRTSMMYEYEFFNSVQ
ncbi:hypothetical protein ScPMuIL_017459 [Solemya velum]